MTAAAQKSRPLVVGAQLLALLALLPTAAAVDCAGVWGPCSQDCTRAWEEEEAPSGGGAACPEAFPACGAGEGDCPAASVDCAGVWGPCSQECHRA